MVSPRLFTMGLVTSPFIAQALSRSPREAFRRCTTRASSLLSATMLAGSCRTSRPGCALVNWHIELGVEPICHPPDDGAVRGDGYENVALGRGPGVSLGEWVARPDMESDEPLLAGIQARTARGRSWPIRHARFAKTGGKTTETAIVAALRPGLRTHRPFLCSPAMRPCGPPPPGTRTTLR